MEIAFDESFGALFCDAEFEFAAKVASAPDDVNVFGAEVAAVDERDDALHGGVGRGVARKDGLLHALLGVGVGCLVGSQTFVVE